MEKINRMNINGVTYEIEDLEARRSGGNVTPQMYGAKADGVTDDYAAIVAASTYAASAGRPIFFPATPNGYLIGSTWEIPAGVDVEMEGAIKYLGAGDAIRVGSPDRITETRKFTLMVDSGRIEYTEESVGIHLYNCNQCLITIPKCVGFNYGVICDACDKGFAYNQITLGYIYESKYPLTLTNSTSGIDEGWCNDNTFYGGRLGCDSKASYCEDVTCVTITSDCGYYNNNNRFFGTSMEVPATAVHIEYGKMNTFYAVRTENTKLALKCSNKSTDNVMDVGYGQSNCEMEMRGNYISKCTDKVNGNFTHHFSTGNIASGGASNASYYCDNFVWRFEGDGTLTPNAYKLEKAVDHVKLSQGRNYGLYVECSNKDISVIRLNAGVKEGSSAYRFFVALYDENGNNISHDHDVAYNDRSSPFNTKISNEPTKNSGADTTGNDSFIVTIPAVCDRIMIGVMCSASDGVLGLTSLGIDSDGAFSVITHEKSLTSIPTCPAVKGDRMNATTPTASLSGWYYDGAAWQTMA